MVFAHALVALAFGHASMMLPVPRNANDQDLPMVRRNSTTLLPCRVGPTRILIFAISFLFLSLHSFVEANHQQHPALARTASAERMARAKVAIWERSRSTVVSIYDSTTVRGRSTQLREPQGDSDCATHPTRAPFIVWMAWQ